MNIKYVLLREIKNLLNFSITMWFRLMGYSILRNMCKKK